MIKQLKVITILLIIPILYGCNSDQKLNLEKIFNEEVDLIEIQLVDDNGLSNRLTQIKDNNKISNFNEFFSEINYERVTGDIMEEYYPKTSDSGTYIILIVDHEREGTIPQIFLFTDGKIIITGTEKKEGYLTSNVDYKQIKNKLEHLAN